MLCRKRTQVLRANKSIDDEEQESQPTRIDLDMSQLSLQQSIELIL